MSVPGSRNVSRLDIEGVDLVLKLGSNNAGRRCAFDCSADATHYVLSWGMFCGFACDEHLARAIREARD